MRVLLALFLGLWASVANADFMAGVLQQQAQQTTGGGPTLDCSTATCVEETICASGCDYTTITAWEEATTVDLTSGGDTIYIGTITEDLTFSPTTIDGATNSSANARRILRGATALYAVPGTAANIKITCSNNFASCLAINEAYAVLQDLECENTGTSSARCVNAGSGSNVTLNRVIAKAANGIAVTLGSSNRLINSVIYESATGLSTGNFISVYPYNLTLANNTTAYSEGGSSVTARFKNTLFYNNTTDVSGTGSGSTDICHGDSTNNATTQASVPTGCDDADVTWVTNVASGDVANAAGNDWTPTSGGALHNAGADNIMTGSTLEGADWPANIYQDTTNRDVEQYDRGTTGWDIGAIEYH